MRRLVLSSLLLLLAAACPKVERKIYSFDVKAGTGELRFINIVGDEAGKEDNDFLEVLNKMIDGTQLEDENPGWTIVSKELYEADGKLHGLVKFRFTGLQDAGLYKHDKKSPYLWCANASKSETLITTNGDRVPTAPGCVVWGRKQTQLEVVVNEGTLSGTESSLLPVYQRWKAGETIVASDSVSGGLGGLDGLASGFEEAMGGFTGALMEGLAAGLGLTGTTTFGTPVPTGPLKPEQITKTVDGIGGKSTINVCYQSAKAGAPALQGDATFDFVVSAAGKVDTFALNGLADGEEAADCVGEIFKNLTFPTAKEPTTVSWPVTFAP